MNSWYIKCTESNVGNHYESNQSVVCANLFRQSSRFSLCDYPILGNFFTVNSPSNRKRLENDNGDLTHRGLTVIFRNSPNQIVTCKKHTQTKTPKVLTKVVFQSLEHWKQKQWSLRNIQDLKNLSLQNMNQRLVWCILSNCNTPNGNWELEKKSTSNLQKQTIHSINNAAHVIAWAYFLLKLCRSVWVFVSQEPCYDGWKLKHMLIYIYNAYIVYNRYVYIYVYKNMNTQMVIVKK